MKESAVGRCSHKTDEAQALYKQISKYIYIYVYVISIYIYIYICIFFYIPTGVAAALQELQSLGAKIREASLGTMQARRASKPF